MTQRLIHIERWDDFQHYGKRDAPWIKNYTRLLDDHRYRGLTHAQRSVLHGLWLAYSSTHRQIPDDTRWISRYLDVRVTRATLEALNHAGFIRFGASTTLAARYHDASPEEEREEEKENQDLVEKTTQPVDNFAIPQFGIGGDVVDIHEAPRKKTNPDKRVRQSDQTSAYTGCRWVTGANGSGGKFLHDTLGIDFPPADWPFAKPTNAEILAERQRRRVA